MPIELLLTIAVCLAIVFVPPVLLFRPLVKAIADRIAGKHAGGRTQEITELKQRISILEHELAEYRSRVIAIEETAEFTRKLLEKQNTPAAPAKEPRAKA